MIRTIVAALVLLPSTLQAQTTSDVSTATANPSLLVDANGDGRLEIIAFGDSLTRGIGDFIAVGDTVELDSFPPLTREAGYPLRVEGYLGVGVTNAGVPGEVASTDGIRRFAQTIPGARPDVVIIGGGANDAGRGAPSGTVYNTIQTMVNIAFAAGSTPVLITIARPCCDHAAYVPIIESYNHQIRRVALINDVRLADFEHGYANSCRGESGCHLLNKPEGLHPNIEGYDISGEIAAGQLLGIDILTAGGPSRLETALNLPAGSIHTVPDAAPIAQP